jgi:choline dehydrogenase-like flavoprotein
MNSKQTDVLIIGAGVGGGTAAWALARRGFNVTVLEKGGDATDTDYLQYDELHFLQHAALTPSAIHDANVYQPQEGRSRKVGRWWAVNRVGGSSTIWDSNLIRYSEPDFRPATTLKGPIPDADMPDWPWSYTDFEPYFELAESDWGVSGRTRQSPAQEHFREGYEYPMPPLPPHPGDATLKSLFASAGIYPYQSPKGINSECRGGRPPCAFCGFCQSFGCAVTARANSGDTARANAGNTVLAKALSTGRCTIRINHYVTRIDHENGRVKGVFYVSEPGSPERYLSADTVIVAVQPDQSARLFLLSEIPDPNYMVGHYLTYHTKGSLEVLFPKLPPWPRSRPDEVQPVPGLGSLQIRDFYTISDSKSVLRVGGKFSVYDPYTVGTPIATVDGTGLWGAPLIKRLQSLRSHPGAGFSFTGISLSKYDNSVVLDPEVKDPWGIPVARTYYRHHDYDLELSRYVLQKLAEVLEQQGAEIISLKPQNADNPGYGHMHGTLRAGVSPETSVLDANCQSHTVRGLYVLDASWMPTSGASNPSLTIMANSYRVCATIPNTP